MSEGVGRYVGGVGRWEAVGRYMGGGRWVGG